MLPLRTQYLKLDKTNDGRPPLLWATLPLHVEESVTLLWTRMLNASGGSSDVTHKRKEPTVTQLHDQRIVMKRT